MSFSLIKLVKWVIVMLIVCACIVTLCYVAHHDKKDSDNCFSCHGDCSSCDKNSVKKS